MFELNCSYPNGEKLISFVQWDMYQTIIIDGEFIDAPMVHFCNKTSEKALCVRATLLNNNQISVEVPNILLTQPYPISIYVYQITESSGRTILKDQISVIPREKPDDFEYKENYHVIYLNELEEEIIALNKELSDAESLRVQAEQTRTSNENARKSNETTRKNNENLRIQNESTRQSDTSTAINNCKTATDKANDAAERALALVYGDLQEKTVSFTESSQRTNISSEDSLGILFGKIKKWFSDLKTGAFYTVANNLTTSSDGYVLDARQGKVLFSYLSDTITEEDINNIFTE